MAFINKYNTIFQLRYIPLPISPGQNYAITLTTDGNPAVYAIFIAVTYHIHQRGFARGTLAANNRNVSPHCKLILQPAAVYHHIITATQIAHPASYKSTPSRSTSPRRFSFYAMNLLYYNHSVIGKLFRISQK